MDHERNHTTRGFVLQHISVYWEQDKFHNQLLHVLDASFERGPQSFKATPPPAIVPSNDSALARPSKIVQVQAVWYEPVIPLGFLFGGNMKIVSVHWLLQLGKCQF